MPSQECSFPNILLDSALGWAAVHFQDVWQRLTPEMKRVALILALAEFPPPGAPPLASPLDDDDHEMRWLDEGGLIEVNEDARHALWYRNARTLQRTNL